ncbi:hypothetical protein CCACVL1_23443 [Corchorus capsularis]|uniref:Uncharacterized protein n=1 Tax=Corchorus capsularis TaxID=210143 RepID=A0A1R3GTU7_COCAP|nr:hypothetical protein CCACVL1_23443 [Corchorus capsularis]
MAPAFNRTKTEQMLPLMKKFQGKINPGSI